MRIAFVCSPGGELFLPGIVEGLRFGHEVRTCFSGQMPEIEEAVAWAEIVWLEWAGAQTISLTRDLPALQSKRVICRLHSYEAFDGSVQRMNWQVVDDLIFVAPHIRDVAIAQHRPLPQIVRRLHVVPNGVDVDRYTFRPRQAGFELACLGSINYKKGPMLLLHAFRELFETDRRYRLSIAGRMQDVRYGLYFQQMIKAMGLEGRVRLDGWVDDVDGWLADKQYIVCTSLLEGHPVGLLEAMAAGLKPVIHRYVGASGMFPEELLWDTIPQFIDMITTGPMHSAAYRDLVRQRYGLAGQLRRLEAIIEAAPVPEPSPAL